MFPLSVLDLVPVKIDKTPTDALAESLELAQHADVLGYLRYWVAEHHNMVGIASAATSVVIGYLAAGTKNICNEVLRLTDERASRAINAAYAQAANVGATAIFALWL